MDGITFKIDNDRLDVITSLAYRASGERQGIFREGMSKFLPQFNLPDEFEFEPKKRELKKPDLAALYLWVEASFERRAKTRQLMRGVRKVWDTKRWFFNPREVVKRGLTEIAAVVKEDIGYGLKDAPRNFLNNSLLLIAEYGSDPRNTIRDKTVEEARRELIKFYGIGTGIANLFIIYMLDRNIVSPTDPENILLKVDVHKARVLINTGVIQCDKDIRRDQIVPLAEVRYREACRRQGLEASTLDASLWIIGSEVCARKNYQACVRDCPYAKDLCRANVPENRRTGKYEVTKDGELNDTRSNTEQQPFGFMFV